MVYHADLTGAELHEPKTHASKHVNGDDDIQSATVAQKGLMTATQALKLSGIEEEATADQTGSEIKTLYEGEADTNAFTDALLAKLNAIEEEATANPTYATVVLAKAASGSSDIQCYVVETDTFYRYETSGSSYTADDMYILSTGDGGDTRWIGVAGTYAYLGQKISNFVSVSIAGGANFTSIQDAIDSITDAASDNRYCILVYPGDYTEAITMKDYVCLFGLGSRGVAKITQSTGAVLTFNVGSNNHVSNLHLAATGTAKIFAIPSGSTSKLNVIDSKLTYSSATDYVDAITHESGFLNVVNTTLTYTNSGTTTGDNEHIAYSMTGSSAYYFFDRFDITMNIADASDTAVGVEEFNTTLDNEATRSSLVINCTGGADAVGTRIKGSSTNKRINRTNLFLYGNGGTGRTLTTNGDGCTVNLEFNNSSVTGFDLNFQASVESGDTVNATFGLGEGEQGTQGDGTINILVSNGPGSLVCQNLAVLDRINALIDSTGLIDGTEQTYFGAVVNKVGSTGGQQSVIDVQSTNSGSAEVIALTTGTNVSPIKQRVGEDATLGKAWSVDSTVWTDRTTAFNSTGTDVQLFPSDNDVVYVGASSMFTALPIILDTVANTTIDPIFEYWNGSWTTFTPNDGTVGFTQNGTIQLPDLTGDWATTQVNSEADGPWYYIRITRTRNNVNTPPTEDLIQVQDASSGTYEWDSEGNIFCKSLKSDVDITDISTPPTDAELDAAFGTPATVGAGWRKAINDNNGGSNFYEVMSDGTNWWITTWSKAT